MVIGAFTCNLLDKGEARIEHTFYQPTFSFRQLRKGISLSHAHWLTEIGGPDAEKAGCAAYGSMAWDPGPLLQAEQRAGVTQLATPGSFFWTFIDQVTALVERAQLQQENLHLAVLKLRVKEEAKKDRGAILPGLFFDM